MTSSALQKKKREGKTDIVYAPMGATSKVRQSWGAAGARPNPPPTPALREYPRCLSLLVIKTDDLVRLTCMRPVQEILQKDLAVECMHVLSSAPRLFGLPCVPTHAVLQRSTFRHPTANLHWRATAGTLSL